MTDYSHGNGDVNYLDVDVDVINDYLMVKTFPCIQRQSLRMSFIEVKNAQKNR
jgi:hypothetical protein